MAHVGLILDPQSDDPMYRQIFDQIVSRIRSNAYPPGFRLPPTRELARELKTHRNTVTRAYMDLEASGFVRSTVGRGTFVEAQQPARPAGAQPSENIGSIAWPSVVSRAARAEHVRRAERYTRLHLNHDLIKMGRMQPSADLIPSDLMSRCIEHVLNKDGANLMSYSPPEGLLCLREQIATELQARGVPAMADDILVTSGSQQALDIVIRALANPGEKILVDPTTYLGLIELLAISGVQAVPVPRDDHGPDLAALERLAHGDVKALYLMPNGHNPTGLSISTERRMELARWSRASSIPIIEDDFVAGLCLDDTRDVPPYLRALDGDVIHISTFSKRLIPGLRLGFIVAPNRLHPILRSMKRVMALSSSGILQAGLSEFMDRGYLKAHTHRIIPEYRARRDALESALRKHLPPEVTWNRPNHGIVLWLKLPATLDPDRIFEEALRLGVQVSPSGLWSVDDAGEKGIRLTYCAEPTERLVEGAKRLGKAMKNVLEQTRRPGRAQQSTTHLV